MASGTDVTRKSPWFMLVRRTLLTPFSLPLTPYFLLVVLGLALRLYHYLREPSLWHDEAALVVNVLGKTFSELLGPLRFSEAAPPFFLWLEKAVTIVWGDSLYALRAPSLLAACAALLLFVPLARRWLAPAAAPWAVFLMAASDRLLWHGCEAKQYSFEVLAAVAVLAAMAFADAWPTAWRLMLATALAPLVMFTAYPGCFLCGGVLAALLPAVWRSRDPAAWLTYFLLLAVVFGSFALLVTGPIAAQRDATLVSCWQQQRHFPDWNHPWSAPGWIALSTMNLFGYCLKPVGQCFVPLAILGAVALWRQRRFEALTLLVLPPGLACLAACLHAYPYGGVRVMAYAAPAVVLLTAAGIPVGLERLRSRHRLAPLLLTGLLLAPGTRAAWCVARPWERADCASAAELVRRQRQPGDAVTANHWEYLYYFRDLGASFIPLEAYVPTSGRLWVVVTGATSADRRPCLDQFSSSCWHKLERREFARTTVLLVERH